MASTHMCDFLALPVKYKESSCACHWLYCKEHSVREKSSAKPAGRTLFVVNVPPFYTEECVKKLFEECGPILNVYFHKKPTAAGPQEEDSRFFSKIETIKGYKVAYVVFKTGSALESALKLRWKKPKVLYSKEDKTLPTAVQIWKASYDRNIPVVSELQADIDNFMAQYDEKISDEQRKLKETEGQEDEEGWVTVTKKGRKPGFARKESVEQRVLAKEGKKKAKKELLNFYTFQIRESKMNHLAELRQKFEEDKKRVAQLRQSRRFRPF
ncbi:ribosomal RNA-processing protein 7 homolog A [Neocloeon triangulifer]|uniref:ribosomal RNA-processing protein 7 homolog A n=1 Tax=Neocloeon triangulifer TaxID=2078957 RepID=UPI00286F202D|nr:ribosomal RNA-processing protein 7 homolog A [Neocloeon triangulifer]